jgi:polar amino acid transport system substrate-binding protein
MRLQKDGVELDGFIDYLPVIMDLIKQGKPFKIVGKPLYRVPQAIAIEPGDPELADVFKKIIDDMHKDGALSKLSLKWVAFDMTVN